MKLIVCLLMLVCASSAYAEERTAIDLTGTSASISSGISTPPESDVLDPPVTDGFGEKGTIENPYTVAEVINGTASGNNIYVMGYIVGTFISSTQKFTTDPNNNTNFALADAVDETEASKVIAIELPASTGTLRKDWNLSNNKYAQFSLVIVRGTLNASYMGKRGIKSTKEINEAVKIAPSGISSYASVHPINAANLPDGLKAYKITGVTAKEAIAKEFTAGIAAKEGMLLIGTAGATYCLPLASSASKSSDNLLVGVVGNENVTTAAGKTNLGLSNGMFARMEDGTVHAHKAYLRVDASSLSAGAKSMNILFGETTGISEVREAWQEDGSWYDLRGFRVENPRPGIYLHRGRKVVIK